VLCASQSPGVTSSTLRPRSVRDDHSVPPGPLDDHTLPLSPSVFAPSAAARLHDAPSPHPPGPTVTAATTVAAARHTATLVTAAPHPTWTGMPSPAIVVMHYNRIPYLTKTLASLSKVSCLSSLVPRLFVTSCLSRAIDLTSCGTHVYESPSAAWFVQVPRVLVARWSQCSG
jgi:hypothetical protein